MCGLIGTGMVILILAAKHPSPQTASMETAILPPSMPFIGTQKYTAQPQGIVGVVLSFRGDFMPRITPEGGSQPSSSQVTPIMAKIKPSPMKNWPDESAPAPSSPRLPLSEAAQLANRIGWVMSDKGGRFQVGLPPGEYTLLVGDGDD